MSNPSPSTPSSDSGSHTPMSTRSKIMLFAGVAILAAVIVVAAIIIVPRFTSEVPSPSPSGSQTSSEPAPAPSTSTPASTNTGPTLSGALTFDGQIGAWVDTKWDGWALEFAVSEDPTCGYHSVSMSGVNMDTASVGWTWSFDKAVSDSGQPLGFASVPNVRYTGFEHGVVPTDGALSQFVKANGQGQVAMIVNDRGCDTSDASMSLIYVFDVSDGTVILHKEIPTDSTLVDYVDRNIVLSGPDGDMAISDSGEVLWSSQPGTADTLTGYCTPVIGGRWFASFGAYLDIATGNPAPFGQDLDKVVYKEVDGDVFRWDRAAGQFSMWNPDEDAAIWSTQITIPAGADIDLPASFDVGVGNDMVAISFLGFSDGTDLTAGTFSWADGSAIWPLSVTDPWWVAPEPVSKCVIGFKSGTSTQEVAWLNASDGTMVGHSIDTGVIAESSTWYVDYSNLFIHTGASLDAYDAATCGTTPLWTLEFPPGPDQATAQVYVMSDYLVIAYDNTAYVSEPMHP